MKSLFSQDIHHMMLTLHNFGYDLHYVENFLIEFDIFCAKEYPNESILTAEIAEKWIHHYVTHSKQQMDKRVRTMKHLGHYQRSIGKNAYIPDYTIESPRPEEPYLLNDDQLSEFFRVLDHLTSTRKDPNREIIFPVMFRLIYCCGLRSSEACNLKVEDIDFDKGTITIYRSKGYKDREIYMSDDVCSLCFRFHQYYQTILPNREYFFQPSMKKPHYLNTDVCGIFHSVLKGTSFYSSLSKNPTTHGLRHLFAVNSMKKCLETGADFNNWIQYLSKYMGHTNIRGTMYYLHIVANLFPIYKSKLDSLVEGFGVEYVED